MSQLQILIDKAHFFSQTNQSLYITQFVFSIGRLSSARRDHVLIAEHYGMPPFAVFFFFFCGGGKITLIMCGRTDRMAAIEHGGSAWTDGGLCYYSSAPASGSGLCSALRVCLHSRNAGTPGLRGGACICQSKGKKKKTLMVYLGKVCFNRSDLQYALAGHFF